jgi:hypothetical protein
MKNKCKDCGKKVFRNANRCITCSNKSRKGIKHSEQAKEKISMSKIGEKNNNWKGDDIKYIGLHVWVKRNKPIQIKCKYCNKESKLELSNISGEYKRDINDFEWLCIPCHRIKDKKELKQGRKKASSRFKELNKNIDKCINLTK